MKFSDQHIAKCIGDSSFKNLKELEEKNGFIESIYDQSNNKKKFFNLGPKNYWKKKLDKKYINKIEDSFKNEMRELGYI